MATSCELGFDGQSGLLRLHNSELRFWLSLQLPSLSGICRLSVKFKFLFAFLQVPFVRVSEGVVGPVGSKVSRDCLGSRWLVATSISSTGSRVYGLRLVFDQFIEPQFCVYHLQLVYFQFVI